MNKPCPQDSKPSVSLLWLLKLVTNFHQTWKVAEAINAEQCVLKLATSPGMWTHTTSF